MVLPGSVQHPPGFEAASLFKMGEAELATAPPWVSSLMGGIDQMNSNVSQRFSILNNSIDQFRLEFTQVKEQMETKDKFEQLEVRVQELEVRASPENEEIKILRRQV